MSPQTREERLAKQRAYNREWRKKHGIKVRKQANGNSLIVPPKSVKSEIHKDAIVYLKHAEKAIMHNRGRLTQANLLTLLALRTLTGDQS